MEFLHKRRNKDNMIDYPYQENKTETVNYVIMRFSLIFYFVLLGETLLQYLFIEKRIWEFIFFWGVAAVILAQVFLFCGKCRSCCYGKLTMLLFSVLFTYMNVISSDSMVLLIPIPMVTLCMLYMDKILIYAMYLMWGVNAALRFILMTQRSSDDLRLYKGFTWVFMVCMVYALALYMVNKTISSHYKEVCHSLRNENKLHSQLYKQSTVDTTTGLLNRNSYNKYLSEYEESDYSSICCIYIDVNGLHEYNNTYGHQAGDKMLKKVASEMKRCFADHKQYRIGGDEFVIISENKPFKAVLADLKHFREQMKAQNIYIASGMEWRDEDRNLSDMIKKADAKMYQDKERFYKAFPQARDGKELYKKVVE